MRRLSILSLGLVTAVMGMAQERWQARSMTITSRGIVATSQTLASQAGAQILARGGSAVDAAIAANAVLGLVEPMMNGMGGDLFALHWTAKTGELTGLNASGWAPKGLTIAYLNDKGYTSMPSIGIHTVTVPGCVAGWEKMHKRFGKLPWKDLFAPAIYYAENGFPVTEIIQYDWNAAFSKISSDDNARGALLIDGVAPRVGQLFRNPQLAKALRLVAGQGAQAFYRGPIAKAILSTSDRLGGTMDAADLAEYQAEWVDPISVDYRGWKVYEIPPNGQGIAALEMLNLFERFPLGEMRPQGVQSLHAQIEAQKLAYQDLYRWIGDPRSGKIPTAGLLSKAYAAERAKLIDPDSAKCDYEPGDPAFEKGDTIYLTVVDREGNIVSWIQSISEIFGSGIAVDGMGFHLHDRAGGFKLDPEHPNALAGRKRPLHTIIPGFMEKDNLHIGFGIMRGSNQPQAQAQFVSNVVDHQMNIQAAMEAPRFTRKGAGTCEVLIESRVPEEVRNALGKMGHRVETLGEYSAQVGGGQAVMHDSKARVNYGASDARKDGAAIPEPDPYFNQK